MAIARLKVEIRLISSVKKLPRMPLQADNTAMRTSHTLLLSILLLGALPVWAGAQQSHAEIREAIAAFVRAQTLTLPGEVSIKVSEIDRRIARPACQKLEAFLPPGGKFLGNSTVGVRCPGKNGWTLFVPVHVKVSANLLITTKPLQKGQMLHADDISSQSGDMTQAGTLTDPVQAKGKVLKYSIGAGQVLKSDMLRAPYTITQGQTVQIQAVGANFKINSEGHALNNATEGQTVQVRTLSGQVVSGTAQPDGTVAVRP